MTEPASGAPVLVRLGTAADAATAARLHAAQIDEGFLARLGPRFLGRLYRRVALSSDAFLLIADGTEGRSGTAGFLAGALDLGALYRRFLVRDAVVAAASSLPRLLRSLRPAWETLRHGTKESGAGADGADGDAEGADGAPAELLSVAVDPAWRGRRVGTALVDGFLAELDRRGVASAQVVVGAENTAAIALYRRAGFEEAGRFELHRGTTSLVMRRRTAAP